MTNRVTLEQLTEMKEAEWQAIPLDQIQLLIEDVAELKAQAKSSEELLLVLLSFRFGDLAQKRRIAEGKDTGAVRVDLGSHVVVCDTPKTVEWNQAGLRQAIVTIKNEWQDNPDEYVITKLSVSETAYGAWPTSIRRLFEGLRTVKPGRQTYKIETAERSAANLAKRDAIAGAVPVVTGKRRKSA